MQTYSRVLWAAWVHSWRGRSPAQKRATNAASGNMPRPYQFAAPGACGRPFRGPGALRRKRFVEAPGRATEGEIAFIKGDTS